CNVITLFGPADVVTTTSGNRSSLTSVTDTDVRNAEALVDTSVDMAALKLFAAPGLALFSNTETELVMVPLLAVAWLATTRSLKPSRVKSPTAIAVGLGPAGKGAWATKFPAPSPRSTVILPAGLPSMTATSRLPSLLKSAAAIATTWTLDRICAGVAAN